MSTYYRPLSKIPFAQLFDGRLKKYGVREKIQADTTKSRRYLVGCDGILVINRKKDGDSHFTRPSFMPMPWAVCDAISEEFKIEIVSERDHRYWGFATQKEWDAFNEKMAKEDEDEFYSDLLNYVRGKPHGFKRGTVGMAKAKIARTLIRRDPGLVAPKKRDVLLEAVRAIYDRDHSIKVTLTKQDIAAAKMLVARTDDLPKA